MVEDSDKTLATEGQSTKSIQNVTKTWNEERRTGNGQRVNMSRGTVNIYNICSDAWRSLLFKHSSLRRFCRFSHLQIHIGRSPFLASVKSTSKAQFCGFLENVNNKVWIFSIFVRLQIFHVHTPSSKTNYTDKKKEGGKLKIQQSSSPGCTCVRSLML